MQVQGEQQQLKKKPMSTQRVRKKSDLWLHYTGNWVWRSIAALMDTENCPQSALGIADQLHAPLAEVIHALEGLQNLGLLEFSEGRYRRTCELVVLSDKDLDQQSILADHVLISTQIMGRLRPGDPNQKSFYRTSFLATNQELVRDYCKKVDQALQEFIWRSEKCQPDQVYGLSVSLVNVSESGTKNQELQ